MSVRAPCPQCHAACLIAPAHLGKPVRCYQCKAPFTLRPDTLAVGAATSAGKARPRNEDSFLVHHFASSNQGRRRETALLVVADGMGGHEAGDRASGLVIRTVAQNLSSWIHSILFGHPPPTPPEEALAHALGQANRAVRNEVARLPDCEGMGATVVAALIHEGEAWLAHVGDCRAYHHRAGQLTQVTRDHTVVGRMLELGTLTPDEARRHPAGNEVTQAVGFRPELTPSRHRLPLAPGDWLLLACDGLQADLELEDLGAALAEAPPDAPRLARNLVHKADEAGGSDNCTVVAVHCEGAAVTPAAP